jgi:hypothetical protein
MALGRMVWHGMSFGVVDSAQDVRISIRELCLEVLNVLWLPLFIMMDVLEIMGYN